MPYHLESEFGLMNYLNLGDINRINMFQRATLISQFISRRTF